MSTTMTFLGVFIVPAGKGKLEKMSIRTSSIYMAPATMAQRRYLRYLLVSASSPQWRPSPFSDTYRKPIQPLFLLVIFDQGFLQHLKKYVSYLPLCDA